MKRDTPLKQNIRLWYQYLQTAIELKLDINKEYYKSWHITQIRKTRFDVWWKKHAYLFEDDVLDVELMSSISQFDKDFINIKVPKEINYEDAVRQIRKVLLGKTNKAQFHLTNQRFRYLEVDDYLKCWKKKQKPHKTYYDVGYDIWNEYKKKKKSYDNSTKLIRRKFINRNPAEYEDKIFTRMMIKNVSKAQKIIENTAKGQFPGDY